MIGLKNEAELLKKALGQKTFDLNVHPHELQVIRMMIMMMMMMIVK
jgi:hypothetical protein